MFRPSKSVLSFGAGAFAVIALTLAAPKAAHAIAATLVQVTNTAANPAIAQSPNTQAAQLVYLEAFANPAPCNQCVSSATFGAYLQNANFSNNYSIPAGETLVITAVDILPQPNLSNNPGQCNGATAAEYVNRLANSGGANYKGFAAPAGLAISH